MKMKKNATRALFCSQVAKEFCDSLFNVLRDAFCCLTLHARSWLGYWDERYLVFSMAVDWAAGRVSAFEAVFFEW